MRAARPRSSRRRGTMKRRVVETNWFWRLSMVKSIVEREQLRKERDIVMVYIEIVHFSIN